MAIFIQDYMGKIVFLVGVILLVFAVLTLSLYGTFYSAGALFFGIVFTSFGLMVQLGFFSGNLRSLSGVGTIAICTAVVLFALSISLAEFVRLQEEGIGSYASWGRVFYIILFSTQRPFMWISNILVLSSVALFIAGIVFKIVGLLK